VNVQGMSKGGRG